jgi:IPT/TIG domain
MPTLPAGSYQLRVVTTGGYADRTIPLQNAPRIISLTPPAGSLAGGQVVTIATEGAPLQTGEGAQNSVMINRVPCAMQSVSEDSITCETGRVFGIIPTTVRLQLHDEHS